jgi:Ribbon-helix-helix protein, copG family
MKRTQIYLSERIWTVLHMRAEQQGISISELIRQAVRDKYGSSAVDRREVMRAIVALRKGRRDLTDSATYVRQLRKGTRLRRIPR